MRILVLNHNDQGKGTYFRCLFLSKYLCQYGNNVVLSCLNPRRDKIRTEETQIDDIKVFLLTGQHGSSSLSELPFHILRALTNVRLATNGQFDMIYFFNIASPTTGLPLIFVKFLKTLGLLNAKLVVDCDDWWGKGGLTSIGRKGWFIETVATLLEEKLPLLADKVTIVSDMLRERVLRAGVKTQNVIYLPNGANVESQCSLEKRSSRIELGLPVGMNILCWIGRALTSFDYLVNSISMVVNKMPNTVAVFIAPLATVHIEKIRNLGLAEKVICVGEQRYERLPLYLSASDILLMPRADNNSDWGNYPGRLGDYLAAGRPIVATAIGEVTNVLREHKCGLLAIPDDPADFAHKILELLKDSRLREDMGKCGREVAEHKLSWQLIVKQLIQELML